MARLSRVEGFIAKGAIAPQAIQDHVSEQYLHSVKAQSSFEEMDSSRSSHREAELFVCARLDSLQTSDVRDGFGVSHSLIAATAPQVAPSTVVDFKGVGDVPLPAVRTRAACVYRFHMVGPKHR